MSEDSVDIEVTIAQRMLGLSYKNGTGVAKDTSVAATWFEKAAAHKDIPSLMSLGTLYQRGLGVDEDGERAFALYQQAANLGKKKRPDSPQNVTQHSQSKASSLDGYESHFSSCCQASAIQTVVFARDFVETRLRIYQPLAYWLIPTTHTDSRRSDCCKLSGELLHERHERREKVQQDGA
jgi:TPR repeat protein